ncbi:MAG: sensor histidine kinase, partial [Limisphaerales bacterium]
MLRSYAEVEKIVALRTRQLEEANTRLLHSQKMTALGSLAAGIAHDFNSILSIIKGSAQIIESNPDDREKIKLRTERIKTAVEQGSEVVNAMLGFSRPADNNVVRCDVNGLIDDTIKLLGDRFQHDLRVLYKPSNALPEVFASPNLIQQVLLNFIFNSADALDGKGTIEIVAEVMAKPPTHAVLTPGEARQYVAIAVCDNGCGISAENLPRIFEPFFTTKALSSRRGTGLGLSMVYQIAKEMNCGLAVESGSGSGSRFTVIVPVKDP